jgi:hypothetical protein
VDVGRRLLSRWVRETALTLLRSHPFADTTPEEYEHLGGGGQEFTWKEGLKRLVSRWIDSPELVEAEAPAVPAPHPDAAPSGAPRGVGGSDLLELKGLVLRLCWRGTKQCLPRARGVCKNVHPGTLTNPQGSPWARDELERITRDHPYQHLTPAAYQIKRCNTVEQVWKAGLIRQVNKWIEWHCSRNRLY